MLNDRPGCIGFYHAGVLLWRERVRVILFSVGASNGRSRRGLRAVCTWQDGERLRERHVLAAHTRRAVAGTRLAAASCSSYAQVSPAAQRCLHIGRGSGSQTLASLFLVLICKCSPLPTRSRTTLTAGGLFKEQARASRRRNARHAPPLGTRGLLPVLVGLLCAGTERQLAALLQRSLASCLCGKRGSIVGSNHRNVKLWLLWPIFTIERCKAAHQTETGMRWHSAHGVEPCPAPLPRPSRTYDCRLY